jgi:hypothetical protein
LTRSRSHDENDPLFLELRRLHQRAHSPSARDLAADAGLSKTTVNYALRGAHMPSWHVVEALVRTLGGDVEDCRQMYWRSNGRQPRARRSRPSWCPRCFCQVIDPAGHEPVCLGRHHTLAIEVSMAPTISEDSWLNEDRFEAFRAGYAYAARSTNAIFGLAKLDPEEAYYVWSLIQRGIEKHRGEPHQEDT